MRAARFRPYPRPDGSIRDGGGGVPAVERLRTAAQPVGLLVAGLGAAGYLWSHNPHLPGQFLPFCPWRRLTGLQCPGCGGTRMVYDLTHGDLAAAWHDNAALLLAFPLVAWLYATWLRHGLAGRRWQFRPSRRTTFAILAVAVAWTVVRNLY